MNKSATCIHTSHDEHGPIYVYEDATSRILSFDGRIQQGYMQLDDIHGPGHGYTQAMMTSLLFIPEPETITVMGLGAGSMVKNLLHSFNRLQLHAVENRQHVADIARKYFYLPETERLQIHIDHAHEYIKNTTVKSNIIFSDLYNSEGMDSIQLQADYLHDCNHALAENGILALNIWHSAVSSSPQLMKQLSQEFENHILSFNTENGNIIVLAFKNTIPEITRKALLDKGKQLQQKMNISLQRYCKLLWIMQKNKLSKN